MNWSRRPAGTFVRCATIAPAVAVLQWLATSPAAAVDHWPSPTDAFTQLWNARLPTTGNRWPVDSCNDYAGLSRMANFNQWSAYIRDPAAGQDLKQYYHKYPRSKLVIPSVKVDDAALTIGVAAIARSLLGIDLTATGANTMLPAADPNPPTNDPKLAINEQFWKANLRSAHANAGGYLPPPDLSGVQAACPARITPPQYGAPKKKPAAEAPDRFETLDVLQANTVLTAAQKWQCYALRFNSASSSGSRANLAVVGFVEVGQKEPLHADQYDNADSRGRFVFDYVNKRVYYNPDHYHPWYKAAVGNHPQFSPVDRETVTVDQICSPWFEIVP